MLTRRGIGRCLVGALAFAALPKLRFARSVLAADENVGLGALKRAFAPPATAPELLLAFGRWLDNKAPAGLPFAEGLWGDHGAWTDRFDEHWIEEGADLAERFALIIPIGDGSQIALWNRSGGSAAQWPVVLMGGEGEAAVLADTLVGFLCRIALAQFDEPDDVEVGHDGYSWLEFQTTIEADDTTLAEATDKEHLDLTAARTARAALGNWLRVQVGQDDLAGLALRRTPYGALRDFFHAHLQSVHDRQEASPQWLALRELMHRHVPFGRLAIPRDFQIVCAGNHFAMGTISRRVFTPFEDGAKAAPIIRALREERATRFPAHGLWFSATLRLYPRDGTDSLIDLVARHLNPPDEFPGMPALPVDAIGADFRRYPRTSWWTPDWLQAIRAT